MTDPQTLRDLARFELLLEQLNQYPASADSTDPEVKRLMDELDVLALKHLGVTGQ